MSLLRILSFVFVLFVTQEGFSSSDGSSLDLLILRQIQQRQQQQQQQQDDLMLQDDFVPPPPPSLPLTRSITLDPRDTTKFANSCLQSDVKSALQYLMDIKYIDTKITRKLLRLVSNASYRKYEVSSMEGVWGDILLLILAHKGFLPIEVPVYTDPRFNPFDDRGHPPGSAGAIAVF